MGGLLAVQWQVFSFTHLYMGQTLFNTPLAHNGDVPNTRRENMQVSRLTVQKMIAVTAMAMALPMSAYAGHHEAGEKQGHSDTRGHHHAGMGMLKNLDLTEEQKAKVKEIMSQQKVNMKQAMGERRAHRDDMRALVEADTFDAQKARALIAQQQAAELDMKLAMLKTQHEIYKVLTPAQREKAKAMQAQYKDKRSERRAARQADPAAL
jgi:periplasmic protein CpxP/Spy